MRTMVIGRYGPPEVFEHSNAPVNPRGTFTSQCNSMACRLTRRNGGIRTGLRITLRNGSIAHVHEGA
jgi:hypothetical protein